MIRSADKFQNIDTKQFRSTHKFADILPEEGYCVQLINQLISLIRMDSYFHEDQLNIDELNDMLK